MSVPSVRAPVPSDVPSPIFNVETQLQDGRPSLLIDPGSVGNLNGSVWVNSTARAALPHGYQTILNKRSNPLAVRGVGHGSQSCNFDGTSPLAMKRLDGII